MFDSQLKPIYNGRVLVNQSAMNDPVIQSALAAMAARNFQDLPRPNPGTWYISDKH
tara:strand:- start:296 stop:463 length:168 start_codon:yes stop_codon:yes gene_type:complete